MTRVVLLLAALVATACGASGGDSLTVHPDGRIGPLKIDVSSETAIREFAGKPFKIQPEFWPGKPGQFGRTLYYRCGQKCLTAYSISRKTGTLSDYWTQSPRFETQRGSRVGMSAVESARREGTKPRPGCGYPTYIRLRLDDDSIFVLAIWKGRIAAITYLGPHTVYYDGLC